MRYKTDDENIILEDTGYIKVHNYPGSEMTYPYATRVYRQYEKDKLGYKEVDGEPIYFHDMSHEQSALARIIGNAQNALSCTLRREIFLKPISKKS